MKKPLLSLVTAILLTISSQAQTEFGLKAGVSFPSYSYANSEMIADTKPITSYYLAGYVDARIAPMLYLYPEVSLQGKGARVIKSILYGGDEIIQSVKWLDLSVNLLSKVPISGIGKFFAGAGPYLGFAMNGENKYADGSTSAVIIYKDNAIQSFDYGVNFLAGFKLGSRLSLNANYRLGLANITHSTNKWSNDLKNRVFSLGLGVSF